MSQNPQVLSSHLQKMIFEMELRGYAQHTRNHYLGHLRLLEKHTNKSQYNPRFMKFSILHLVLRCFKLLILINGFFSMYCTKPHKSLNIM